ncbi:hypothetical protein IW492_03095 [Enterococcus sp. BWB1-3]|uniref:hypothetical protein n=1 Tax=Enterococcus sp. BWB1-3 TaxID=2787713 RepID=UPI0019237D78|nr:hypothetical protein [Enterococcus sp. BWB1-3]MBL1228219.1 hypothetical protein [Enterococcus sp. BWB1-3]
MKKYIFTSLLIGFLFCPLGAVSAQADNTYSNEQEKIEQAANEPVIPIPFEELSEETKVTILAEKIDIENTTFYKSIFETYELPTIRTLGYIGTVVNYYFVDQTTTFKTNKISKGAPYGHTYKTINVRKGYTFTSVYYYVSTKAKTKNYRTDKLKVILQYKTY